MQKGMSYPASVILSIYGWTLVTLSTVFFSLLGLLLIPVSLLVDRGSRRIIHGVAVFWARLVLVGSVVWKLRVEGEKNIVPGRPYIIVANHQSLLDILVALVALPVHFKFLAKKELFSIPFLGWHLALAGYIPIDRSSPESGKRALLGARKWLRQGVSVLFFPEGTRSLDGQIQEFKPGAFKLAEDESVDILPVVIDGTGQAVPKKSWRLAKPSRFSVSIGKPVSMTGRAYETKREAIRQEMAARLARIRANGA